MKRLLPLLLLAAAPAWGQLSFSSRPSTPPSNPGELGIVAVHATDCPGTYSCTASDVSWYCWEADADQLYYCEASTTTWKAVGGAVAFSAITTGTNTTATMTLGSGSTLNFSADTVIAANTSDGSDNLLLQIGGGGAAGGSRGATLQLYGNEDGITGSAALSSGTPSASYIKLVGNGSGSGTVELTQVASGTDPWMVMGQDNVYIRTKTGASGGGVFIASGTTTGAPLGLGGQTAAECACIIEDGSDNLWTNRDCQETLDPGDERIDYSTRDAFSHRRHMAWYAERANTTASEVGMGSGGGAMTMAYNAVANADDATGAFIQFDTTALGNNDAGVYATAYAGDSGWLTSYTGDEAWGAKIQTGSAITSTRYWIGAVDASPMASATPPVGLAAFRYDAATDTNWMACTNSGADASLNCTDTGVAVAVDTSYEFAIDFNGTTSVDFWINEAFEATSSSDIPDSTDTLGSHVMVRNTAAVVRSILVSRISITHD